MHYSLRRWLAVIAKKSAWVGLVHEGAAASSALVSNNMTCEVAQLAWKPSGQNF
jgi:hypothetical protein